MPKYKLDKIQSNKIQKQQNTKCAKMQMHQNTNEAK